MSYSYYQQFRDDEDLFPVLNGDDEDDTDVCQDYDDTDLDQNNECCVMGCKYCLGTEW